MADGVNSFLLQALGDSKMATSIVNRNKVKFKVIADQVPRRRGITFSPLVQRLERGGGGEGWMSLVAKTKEAGVEVKTMKGSCCCIEIS